MGLFDGLKKKSLVNKGVKLLNQGKFEESVDCFDKTLKIKNIDNAYAWCMKASAITSMGNYQEGLKCYDTFLKIDPEFGSDYFGFAWFAKGLIIQNLENIKKAMRIL